MTTTTTAQRIVSEARGWLGTPYCHGASVKGVGCDCLGLVRGVWRAVFGGEPERADPYSPDWAEAVGEERLRDAARRHLAEIPVAQARPGDLLLFRPDGRADRASDRRADGRPRRGRSAALPAPPSTAASSPPPTWSGTSKARG